VRRLQLPLNSATVPYQLEFGKILNRPTADVSATSKVSTLGTGGPVEVVLVLDNTNSMNYNGKIVALKSGVRKLIDEVEESGSDSKIAILPFAKYVNVG